MSFGAVLDKLGDVLREATQARQFLQYGVTIHLEALQKGQAELLAITRLTLRADTHEKAMIAWEKLARERMKAQLSAEAKLDKVRAILARHECGCEWDDDCDGHNYECDRCLACRIGEAVGK